MKDMDGNSSQPFEGVILSVTGLSATQRRLVNETVTLLGGKYSGVLSPHCTHLLATRKNGPKYEHAQKYGHELGLKVVPFSWLVDSAKLKVRLDESAYTAQIFHGGIASESRRQHGLCKLESKGKREPLPVHVAALRDASTLQSNPSHHLQDGEAREGNEEVVHRNRGAQSSRAFYIDPQLPEDVRFQVREDLRKISCEVTDELFAGGKGSHVVCDPEGARRHMGRNVSLVTPLWVSRSAAASEEQPLLHCSPDIVVHIARELRPSTPPQHRAAGPPTPAAEERRLDTLHQMVREAKEVVRGRRGRTKQPCRTIPKTPTPVSLLEYICWTVTDPPEAGLVCGTIEPGSPFSLKETELSDQWGSKAAPDVNTSEQLQAALEMRSLTDRELDEVEYKHPFLTILFPIDRYGELGVRSRNLHSTQGFSRRMILQAIYEFYQEDMCEEEVQVAIHTDSRHAHNLRLDITSTRNRDGRLARCKFIGSRKSYDGLGRVGRDHRGLTYELLLVA